MSDAQDRILVVEDDVNQRRALVTFLELEGFLVDDVGSAEEALELLAERSYGVLVTDLHLPGLQGTDLIQKAGQTYDDLGMLMATAHASLDTAIEALRAGAHDYLLKPLILEDVLRKIKNLLTHRTLVRDNARLRRMLQDRNSKTDIVANSEGMQEALRWCERAAGTQATVLITGETGTGKEVIARAIHELSPYAEEPFLAVNVAALPEDMIVSELFGYERGAFTGAAKRREGILRAAGKGTVFLDEIGELSPAVQAKLLRALEQHEVQPLGSDVSVDFEARILAATHRDLKQQVEDSKFRQDLYFRLNVLQIHLPPLRERPEDIPHLARHLLDRHATRSGLPIPVIAAEAMRALTTYKWVGNVRELSNVLERALILADQGRIELGHLPEDVVSSSSDEGWNLKSAVERFERNHIAIVLKLCKGSREQAAQELGLSQATLYRRLDKLGLKGS